MLPFVVIELIAAASDDEPSASPKNTPAAIVERLNTTLNEILQDADMKASMAKEGVIPSGGTALAFGQRTRDEYDRWAKVVARANIRAQPE